MSKSAKEISIGNGTVSTLSKEKNRSLLPVIGASLAIVAMGTLFALSLRLFPTLNERVASLAAILLFQSEPVSSTSLESTAIATSTTNTLESITATTTATTTPTVSRLANEQTIASSTITKTTPPPAPVIEPGPITTNTYPIENTSAIQTIQTGRVDLVSEIIEIGTLDRISGAFTPATSFKSTDRIAVRFQIKNIGGRESGSWYFNAVLPTFPSHIFTSESQQSLVPGARIEYTLGFDNVSMTAPTREFVVNADPANSIGEADDANNIARVSIDPITP